MNQEDMTAPWHVLAEGSFGKFIEALRHISPENGYHKSDLAEAADVTTSLLYRGDLNYIARAEELGILRESNGLYYLNEDSEVLKQITLLNASVDRRLADEVDKRDE